MGGVGGSEEGSEGSVSRCLCLGWERLGEAGEAGRPRSAGNPGLLFPGFFVLSHLQDCRGRGRVLLGARPHALRWMQTSGRFL